MTEGGSGLPSSFVSIDLGAFSADEQLTIQVFDMAGKLMEQRQQTGGGLAMVELNAYKAGSYIVHVRDAQDRVKISRFAVAHLTEPDPLAPESAPANNE